MVAWFLVLRNLRDDGRYLKWGLIAIAGDFIVYYYLIGNSHIPGIQYLVYFPLFLLFCLSLILLVAIRNEVFYFNRTMLGMNQDDRKLGRKAMKSGKMEDFSAVAQYVDWNQVS